MAFNFGVITLCAAEKPLNVLFILTDDQTQNTVHQLGNQRISTPNLDRLAQNGMSFTHVFNQGSWSPAVCAPSRRMINTGRHLYSTGMGLEDDQNGKDASEFKMFGETFKDAGYETFMSGKWHLPLEIIERSFSTGKAIFDGGMSTLEEGGQWNAAFIDYNPSAKVKYTKYKAEKHTSEMIADVATDFLEKQVDSEKPFMMYVAFLAPHDPRQSPDEYVKRYLADTIDVPNNFAPEHPFNEGDHLIRDELLAPYPRTPEIIQKFIGEYYAMIEHTDAQIGRILDALEASGKADNTLVIFTSDHGLAVGKHGLLGKQNQYDHSIRAPFIIKGPMVPKNISIKGMFYINSVFPTAVEMAGLDIPTSVQAPSIASLVRGEKKQIFDSIYGSYKHFQRMLRTDDYKLIHYPEINKTQLFYLKSDPDEMHNLAGLPQHKKRIKAMFENLKDWQTIVNDPLELN